MKRLLLAASVLVLFFSHAVPAAEPVVTGRLCWMAANDRVDVSKCAAVRGRRFDVAADPNARRYAWLRSDGKELVVGRLEKAAIVVDLSASSGVARLKLQGARDWPAPVEIDIDHETERWKLVLPGAATLQEIHLPPATYDFRFAAGHHQPLSRVRTKIAEKPFDFGVVTLSPLPRFTAVVKREDGSILGGATLTDDYGKLLATADDLGRLTYEADCETECVLPARVSVDYPGLAGVRVLVTSRKGDFDAGAVTLGSGGSLELTVRRPEGKQFPVEVEVAEALSNDRQRPRTLARASLKAGDDRLRIDRLPVGKSALYLRGSQPTQVLSDYITIEPEKVNEFKVEILPTDLTIQVTKGGSPIPGAEVTVGVPHGKPDYEAALSTTNEDGKVSATVWQSGTMVATAVVGAIREIAFFTVGVEREQTVPITISPTVLKGRIFEAATQEPLKDVSFGYQWESEQGGKYDNLKTDDEGRYEVENVRAGKHKIHIEEPGFLLAEAAVESTGNENELTLNLPLIRGQQHKVTLEWDSGGPIAGARVVQVIESRRRYQNWTSDTSGEFTVALSKDRPIELWIVPPEGSFGVATVDSTTERTTVRLARPGGMMIIRTVGKDGTAMPSSHLGLRYQGKPIDYFVLGAIHAAQGLTFRTGADATANLRGFPAGAYEIWATQYDGDDLSVGEPRNQPVVSVYHAGGEQTVKVEAVRFNP